MSVTSRPQPKRPAVAARRRRRKPVRWLVWIGASLLLGVVAFGALQMVAASRAAARGKQALLATEHHIDAQEFSQARRRLTEARASFTEMRRDMRRLGPLLAVARVVPLVRVQVRGVEAFGDAGVLVSDAGLKLMQAASGIIEPGDTRITLATALQHLKGVRGSAAEGVSALDEATRRVRALDGYRLLGPLATARADLSRNLDRIARRAESAQSGLDAVIALAGGDGPRRYLVFSQNPDEVRPTGGFIGTYGVISATAGGLSLERYEGIERWLNAHPDVSLTPEQMSNPFLFYDPPLRQSLSNVNAVPDWPRAAGLAMDLWRRAGEEPVDGVLSLTPACLARVLKVIGPVQVPDFGETVTAANVVERFDFYTRENEAQTETGRLRKEFVADLAREVLTKLLATPSSQWVGLGQAVGHSLAQREALAWSRDAAVTKALTDRQWDGTLPKSRGDFVFDSEVEYAAKNGRALRRTFDHHVKLEPDGSALITTTLTIRNTEPYRPLNPSSLGYHTMYGPVGATLDPASDPPASPEPTLNGHPAAGWFLAAPPEGTATLKVVWRAPSLTTRLEDGSWAYGLWLMHLPDHTGDVLNLQVELPSGWKWKDEPPPERTEIVGDVVGVWRYGP